MAERWEQVNHNVARLVTAPRVMEHKIEPLTLDEVRRLLDAARLPRDTVIGGPWSVGHDQQVLPIDP